jgi:hypothetical protein
MSTDSLLAGANLRHKFLFFIVFPLAPGLSQLVPYEEQRVDRQLFSSFEGPLGPGRLRAPGVNSSRYFRWISAR